MDDRLYWASRDDLVNNATTKQTMVLVLDLLGNLKDLEEEKPKLKKLYEEFKFNLNEIMRDW